MPVKIFVPKISSNENDFISYIKKICNPSNLRISKNQDGSSFCVIMLNYDENIKCANDIIKEISGKVIGDVVLKPRIYVDQGLVTKFSNGNYNNKDHHYLKEIPDDVVNTTHFQDGFYYIQLLSEKDSNVVLTSLLRSLFEDYKSGTILPLSLDEIVIGKLYATFYNDDQQFYRIKVIEKAKDIKVIFIDYGNDEWVPSENIVSLTEKLEQIAPMVHKCVVSGVKILDHVRHELVAREILHRNYRAKLTKKRDSQLNMDRVVTVDYLDFTSITYRNYLIVEGIADECKSNGIITEKSNGFKEEDTSVILTHFESLDEFYVQPVTKETDDIMVLLNTSIKELVSNLENSSDTLQYIGPDHMYLSQFSQDLNWYRCRVIEDKFDEQDSYCVVLFIDFGNSEKKYSTFDLKPLIEEFGPQAVEISKVPPCANKCKFNDDLIYALSKAKMEKDYFQQNFVICEKTVVFQYFFDRSNKVWIVENIKMDNEEIMSIVLQQCENTKKTDIYRLSNLENLNKMWFQLVKSIDPTVQDQITVLEKWGREQNTRDLEAVKQFIPNHVYCGRLKSGILVRCRLMGKNIHIGMIQVIDTGVYHTVSLESIFYLPESLSCIKPMAKSLKLVFNSICAEEYQIEDKIIQIIGNSNVELDMIDESSIRDVIIKEKSLVQCLAQLDFVQPKVGVKVQKYLEMKNDYQDLPDCLLPKVGETESVEVDFSVTSVEKMNEVPLEISILNSKVRFLRKLFSIQSDNIFNTWFKVVESCDRVVTLIDCCKEVDELTESIETLNKKFTSMSCNIKTKLRNLEPLIEERTKFCEKVCELHSRLGVLLQDISYEKVKYLHDDIEKMLQTIGNFTEILSISMDRNSDGEEIDIEDVQAQITEFRNSDTYAEVRDQLDMQSKTTNELIVKYRDMMDAMYRDYELGDVLPNSTSSAVPLIDRTYEIHIALKSEFSSFLKVLSQEDVVNHFNMTTIIHSYESYLQKQKIELEMVIARTSQLESLHDYANLILTDDSLSYQKIESNHKKIISYRSSLKHRIADMEDAEEQDEPEKVEEILKKIDNIRKTLHESLKESMNIIDPDIRKLMLRKPEFQLKNQSIFFCEEGIPVFLWDSIFFELPHSDSSFVDSFTTRFGDEVLNMKKLPLTTENYRTILLNLTTYSSRTSTTLTNNDSMIIGLLPVLCAFLSKSENSTVYMLMPSFTGVHSLPVNFRKSLSSIISFFKSTITQILNLWHSGFTFSESDLENGLYVTLGDDKNDVCLPLPLDSICNRENINHQCESIKVYFSKLGDLFLDSLNCCTESTIEVNHNDVQVLVNDIKNCKGVEEAEKIFEDLDQFLFKNPIIETYVDSSNEICAENEVEGFDSSSSEKIDGDDEACSFESSNENINGVDQEYREKTLVSVENSIEVDEPSLSNHVELNRSQGEDENDVLVTEQVLEMYANVE